MKEFLLFAIIQICFLNLSKSQNQWKEPFNPFIMELTLNPIKDSEFNVLDNLIDSKKIVAIGESTHGTKEFFGIKTQLVKFLIEKKEFKVFVIEDNFSSTQNVDDFVAGKSNINPEKVITHNWFKAWWTPEVLELLIWIKSYNEGKSEEERVKIYGCDMQNYISPSIFIKSELIKENQFNPELENKLDFLINSNMRHKMTHNQKSDVKLLIRQLYNIVTQSKNQKLDFNVRILEQSIDLSSKGILFSQIARDKYMAENCKEIFKLNSQKMIIWAHNQHIAEHSDSRKIKPMGAHLKSFFNGDYYAIGFNFYSGEFLAYDPEKKKSCSCKAGLPKSDCVDNIFAEAPYENFLIDLKQINLPNGLSDLSNRITWSRVGGSTFNKDSNAKSNYRKCVLSKSFDTLIFIRNTNAVKRLEYVN